MNVGRQSRSVTAKSAPARTAGASKAARPTKRNALPDEAMETVDALNGDPGDSASRAGIRLGFLIHDVSRMRRVAYDQFMKPLGITRAQWWVLANLSRNDGMMQTQLADVLDVGKASLGDVIESLESRGWVTRRQAPKDKRAKCVFLTRKALDMIKRMTAMEDEFNRQVLRDISPAEQTELVRVLQKIKESITKFSAAEATSRILG